METEVAVKPEPVWLVEDESVYHAEVEDEVPISPISCDESKEEIKTEIQENDLLEEYNFGIPTVEVLMLQAPRKSKSNLDFPACSDDNTDSSYKQSENENENSMPISGIEENKEPRSHEDGKLIIHEDEIIKSTKPPCSSPRNPTSQRPGTSKRKKYSPEDDLLACATQVLSAVSAEDSDDEFSKFVASRLRKIQNKKLKMSAQHKMLNILMEVQLQDTE